MGNDFVCNSCNRLTHQKMKKEDAKKKKKFHLNRYNYYKKKQADAEREDKRIGFRFGK